MTSFHHIINISEGQLENLISNKEITIDRKNNRHYTSIRINNTHSNTCWLCGRENTEKHHAINKALKPKQNVVFYLCNECHTLLHSKQSNLIKSSLNHLLKYIDVDFKVTRRKLKKKSKDKLIKTVKALNTQLNIARKQRDEFAKQTFEKVKIEQIKFDCKLNVRM